MNIINAQEGTIQVGGFGGLDGSCAIVCLGSCAITAPAVAMGLAITAF